ncbi:MAG: hypothetical protein IJO59_01410 [Clostridia bacterium]|nr:hypothetical protein [Clostridia bacterium]
MKKKLIIGAFSLLIFITVIVFLVVAIGMYKEEVANEDTMVGLGAAMVLAVGGLVVFYELDLFYTVYYFFIKPKTIIKSTLNIVSNVMLLMLFFTDSISHFLFEHVSEIFAEETILLLVLFLTYVMLRMICAAIPGRQSSKDNERW